MKRMFSWGVLAEIFLLMAFSVGCAAAKVEAKETTSQRPSSTTKSTETSAYDPTAVPPILDLGAIDPSVKACDNFYQYACGNWLKSLQLPGDKAKYWHQSTALEDRNLKLVEKMITQADESSKISMYYHTCLRDQGIRGASWEWLQQRLSQIQSIHNSESMARVLAQLQLEQIPIFFSAWVGQDLKNSRQMILFLDQSAFALPEKDYYFNTDQKARQTRQKYQEYIAQLLATYQSKVRPQKEELQWAKKILDFETQFAKVSLSLEEMMDPEKIYSPHSLDAIQKMVPEFDWKTYFSTLKKGTLGDHFNATPVSYFRYFNRWLAKKDWKTVKAYMTYRFVNQVAAVTVGELNKVSFQFWEGFLAGKLQQEAREKICVRRTQVALRDDLAQLYVASFPEAQARRDQARQMIQEIKTSFHHSLNHAQWLDESTRQEAHQKLDRLNPLMGYPDQWISYQNLSLQEGESVRNWVQAQSFEAHRQLEKLGQPVDDGEFDMAAWELNAYYNPSKNQMVFPLVNLQSPLFDLRSNIALNMGALGATMGHEMIHGFDSAGSKMDGAGNLRDWWSSATRKGFDQGAQCLAKQASAYEILPQLNIKGSATLTENIADQGGTRMAYQAYRRKALQAAHSSEEMFSMDQQFFLSYAHSWCAKSTESKLRSQVLSDPHPPEEFRVNGVLMNMPEFSEAFQCHQGVDRMAPTQRCSIW